MIENSDDEQIERLNSRIIELLRERDALVEALQFFADGNNWMREAACDPNSGNFRGTTIALDVLASIKGNLP